METNNKTMLTVATKVNASLHIAWQNWTLPEHIVSWNTASLEWQTISAENDLRRGGRFSSRMEAKDGSGGFDFCGTYDEVADQEHLA